VIWVDIVDKFEIMDNVMRGGYMISKQRFFFVVIILFVFAASTCSFYHMQTPETVRQDHVVGGIGLGGIVIDNQPIALPGMWIRTGLGKNTDIGIHTWGLGVKADLKQRLDRCFAVGGGGAMAFMAGFAYSGEASLYAGLPGRMLSPYAVGRFSFFGFSAPETDIDFDVGTGLSTVAGLRIKFGKTLATYLEGGLMVPVSEEDVGVQPIFGVGFAIGQ